jgi:DUF1680 family protein
MRLPYVSTLAFYLAVVVGSAAGRDLPNDYMPPPTPGPYAKPAAADSRTPSFASGTPLIATTYFYWYDAESREHVVDSDDSDALTDHPPTLDGFSYKNVAWHAEQLQDMIAAGIDVVMPVYWGTPAGGHNWSNDGLPKLVAAREQLVRRGQRPPAIAMFYDTSTLQYNGGGYHVDLRMAAGREWFFATIRDFFSLIPPAHRASIDGKPLVFLYSPSFAQGVDEQLFPATRTQFKKQFGVDLYLVKMAGWPGKADAEYMWGGAIEPQWRSVAAFGPGYDHAAVPDRKPLVRDREGGAFYQRAWERLLQRAAGKRPWLVHLETWNEFHEGTEICETKEYGRQYIELTRRFADMFHAREQLQISNQSPDTEQANDFYPANRLPLSPSALIKLPVGAVRPEGWLRKQLELQADGFHGHLTEISKFLAKDKNAWLSPDGSGTNGWEELPYWLKGFGDCAYLLGNEDQIKEAKIWIEGALASQRDDGFFGPRGKGAASTVSSTKGKYDLWPNMVMLVCLQSYYEYTGDERVIDLMSRYFKWQLSVPEEDFLPPYWQQQRAADNLWSVYWLYNRTGDKWLLELAEKIHRRTANWSEGVPDWHNVNMSQAFGGPAFFYPQSKDPLHLQAAERNYRTIREVYGQVPGGMFGGDENCRPGFTGPRQAIETCGMVEMMFSHERLLTVTGNLAWADRCEDVAFNSLPAALTADFKALRYLTAPNLVLSDRQSKSPGFQNSGPMLHMNPHIHRCCQHNFGHGWPYFTEHLWFATPGNGLAAVMYAPSRVTVKVGDGEVVTIHEETHYPFDEQIDFTISTPRAVRFPLYLRVPGWCVSSAGADSGRRLQLSINGQSQSITAEPLGYIRIDRIWSDSDRVRLTLPMEVSIRKWTKNQNSVSIDRGPLTYSLAIGEKYIRAGGTERWPAWEIRPTTPWNYGLILDHGESSKSFKVIKHTWPNSNMPFTIASTPIALEAQAKRVPEWKLDSLGLVGKLQPSPVRSNEPEETIRLIPMGAARLRISSFPVISSPDP